MLCVEKGLTDYERVWVVHQILSLLVVYGGRRAISQLGLVLLTQESLGLLRLCGELANSFLLFFLVLPDVVLGFKAWERRRMGPGPSKAVVSTRSTADVQARVVVLTSSSAVVLIRVIKTVIATEAARKAPLVLKFVGLVILGTLALEWRAVELLLLLGILGVVGLVRRVAAHMITWHPFVAAVVAIIFWVAIGRALVEISTSPLLRPIVVTWCVELPRIVELGHAFVRPVVGTLRALRTLWTLAELLWVVRPILLVRILLASVKFLIELWTTITIEIVVPPLRHLLRAARIVVVIGPLWVLSTVVRTLVRSIVVGSLLRPAVVLLWVVVLMLLVALKVLLIIAIGYSASKLVEL